MDLIDETHAWKNTAIAKGIRPLSRQAV